MRRVISMLLIALVLVILGSSLMLSLSQDSVPPRPKSADFPSGYSVSDPFLTYYETSGRPALLGLPRSDIVIRDGVQVQFFDNAALEWDPAENRVRLFALGPLFHQGETLGVAPSGKDGATANQGPSMSVMPQFAVFYYTHGGADFFGEPISGPIAQNGRLAQYFERARLDQITDTNTSVVSLAPLGRTYLAQMHHTTNTPLSTPLLGQEPSQTGAPLSDPTRQEPQQPKLEISVKHPVTGRGGRQTVDVRLLDLDGRGIDGIPVRITVHERDGDRLYLTDRTHEGGYASLTYPIGNPAAGYTILVDGSAHWAGTEVKGRTSYTPWYVAASPEAGTPVQPQ